MRWTIAWAALVLVTVVSQAWGGIVHVSIEPSEQHAAVGETVSFDVWLRDIDRQGGAVIETVELDFGGLPAGLTFVAGPGVDGFDEHDAPVPSELDSILDGSLLDTHTAGLPDLSYVALNSGGIPSDGSDRLLGTFWVQASAEDTYTLSLDNSATSVLSGDIVEYSKTFSDAVLIVPEPASVSLFFLGLGILLRRRRS